MKRILTGTVLMVLALPCYATGDNVATSAGYVDAALELKQATIPAAGANGVGAGSTVMTYTATSGTIGERALYTDASSYDASTDADKMITASALNGAITSMPTTTTTKLTCQNSPACTLWTISDQTAYAGAVASSGVDPAIMAMLTALIDTGGTGYCYNSISNANDRYAGTCTTAPSNYGDWGTMFTYNNEPVQISGISACSSVNEGLSSGDVATNQSGIDADYATSGAGASANGNPPGANCYCKMTGPAVSRWVFRISDSSASDCAGHCADACGRRVRNGSDFRSGVFGSVQ